MRLFLFEGSVHLSRQSSRSWPTLPSSRSPWGRISPAKWHPARGGLRLHSAVTEKCCRWRGTEGSNPSPSSGESANSRSLCSADLKAMCEASASRLSVPTSPSATQKRVERCSLGRSLALPRTARHIVGRALDIRLESKLSDAMTTARFPARPAEIF